MMDVDALANEIRRVDGNHDKGAGALAEALMPFLERAAASPAGVVKPLEWGEQVHGTWHAIAVVHYSAFQDMDNGKYFVRVAFPAEDFLGPFDTLEAAKSAAFADYSARIMSAIEPAGVGVETEPPSSHVVGPVDFAKLYTHPLAKQFHEAIQAVDSIGCDSTAAVNQLHALAKAVEQEINRLTAVPDDEVTDDMLNEGQERMCQMASRTVFEDHIQAEIYKAMRAVDPGFRTTKRGELRLFGHWSKHKLADGVFLPLVCYVPTGDDYTTVPLYAPATPSPQPRLVGDDWFGRVVSFFVKNGMLDARDEYDISDVMGALHDNYAPAEFCGCMDGPNDPDPECKQCGGAGKNPSPQTRASVPAALKGD